MPRARLRDDGCLDAGPRVLLDDDCVANEVSTLPRMTVLERKMIGRNEVGDRVWGWEEVAVMAVASYESRNEVVDGIDVVKIKATALHDADVDWDASMSIVIQTGLQGDWTDLPMYRVTKAHSNGVTVAIEAERVV